MAAGSMESDKPDTVVEYKLCYSAYGNYIYNNLCNTLVNSIVGFEYTNSGIIVNLNVSDIVGHSC